MACSPNIQKMSIVREPSQLAKLLACRILKWLGVMSESKAFTLLVRLLLLLLHNGQRILQDIHIRGWPRRPPCTYYVPYRPHPESGFHLDPKQYFVEKVGLGTMMLSRRGNYNKRRVAELLRVRASGIFYSGAEETGLI
jgi:hypothetical protein